MNTSGRPADGILLNPSGIYMDPPLTMVIKTLNVFLYGTSRLLFHCYLVEGLTAEEMLVLRPFWRRAGYRNLDARAAHFKRDFPAFFPIFFDFEKCRVISRKWRIF